MRPRSEVIAAAGGVGREQSYCSFPARRQAGPVFGQVTEKEFLDPALEGSSAWRLAERLVSSPFEIESPFICERFCNEIRE